ncbi:biotin--[acetyl-CoA-carboxylase] ligase [Paenibacillus sp. 481]|uniref:biotin--[acetyl-CoA-carboxylase] ligase n=1 Tax=Paenibacillus sp. 481 TaxID=2835869 RepID=UPI001E51E87A|nr:biotin--[acetyl-CoA-carboxylase] ligase [Paenibacillus sp. 481]UHA72992.1 biotin--[acetyl-CoA-carboxylase] ligase [Paenibacillus sp. 481]
MTDRLLELLAQHPNEYVSGEQLSQHLSISRTAVWKQINRLRAKGYEFDAVPKLGYRLLQQPTRLDEKLLLSKLRTTSFGRQLRILWKTESTQNEATAWLLSGAKEGAVVIAEEQTGGRGRRGRNWHSPAGKGIWMSVVLQPSMPLQFTPHLTLLTAVAICRAIKKMHPVEVGIKWPNDLLVNERKVCGILLESQAEDERLLSVIAGIGISANLSADDYPPELREIATSLSEVTGHGWDRAQLIAELLFEFEQLYHLYEEQGFGPIRSLWEAQSITIGRMVSVDTPHGVVTGIAQSLDESGALVLLGQDGCYRKVFSGDVHFA